MRSPDPLVDGRPWHWGVAVALTVPVALALVPLLALAALVGRACDALE